jgi:hypothetical protein
MTGSTNAGQGAAHNPMVLQAALYEWRKANERWVQTALNVAHFLKEARDACGGDDTAFGEWLANNECDELDRNTRAAFLKMAEYPDASRAVLAVTRSIRHIWELEIRPSVEPKPEPGSQDLSPFGERPSRPEFLTVSQAEHPATTSADAELNAACAEFESLLQRIRDFGPDRATPIEDDDERQKVTGPLYANLDKLLNRIRDTRAQTIDGILNKINCLLAWEPDYLNPRPTDDIAEEFLISILRDLLEAAQMDARRWLLVVPPPLVARIDDWRRKQGIVQSRAEAARELLDLGLGEVNAKHDRTILALAEVFSVLDEQLRTASDDKIDEPERDVLLTRWIEVVEVMATVPARSRRGRRAKASAILAFALREGAAGAGWGLALSLCADVITAKVR